MSLSDLQYEFIRRLGTDGGATETAGIIVGFYGGVI